MLWSNSVTWLHMYSLVFLSLERGFFCLTCIPRTEHIILTINLGEQGHKGGWTLTCSGFISMQHVVLRDRDSYAAFNYASLLCLNFFKLHLNTEITDWLSITVSRCVTDTWHIEHTEQQITLMAFNAAIIDVRQPFLMRYRECTFILCVNNNNHHFSFFSTTTFIIINKWNARSNGPITWPLAAKREH